MPMYTLRSQPVADPRDVLSQHIPLISVTIFSLAFDIYASRCAINETKPPGLLPTGRVGTTTRSQRPGSERQKASHWEDCPVTSVMLLFSGLPGTLLDYCALKIHAARSLALVSSPYYIHQCLNKARDYAKGTSGQFIDSGLPRTQQKTFRLNTHSSKY